MDLHLKDKKVVVTASTSGTGFAVARKFLEEGAAVMINGRNGRKAEEKKNLLEQQFGKNRVFLCIGDAASEEGIRKICDHTRKSFGSADCVIANAGSGRPVSADQLDIKAWNISYEINLFSTVRLIKGMESIWDSHKGGSIVTVSSLAACQAIRAPYAYAAAKQGVCVFSKYLSDDYVAKKIRVNSVIPGNIFYKGGRWEELLQQDEAGVRSYIGQAVPMRRFATPEEVANAVVFLASDCASFITGTTLVIDGGQNRSTVF